MMRVTRIVALFATITSVSAGSLLAQTLRTGQVPAEFPPESFTGTQYVDSRGCVFIRAGIDGNTTWVPRVDRQRRQFCGQTPSLSPAARAAAEPSAPVQAPTEITVDTPPETATAPAPEPEVASTPVAKPVPVTSAPRPQAPKAPQVARKPAPKPVPVVEAPPAAPAPSIAAAAVSASDGSAPQITGNTRVVPRHVYDVRLQSANAQQIPEGYRPIWTDDRLNPRRAEQSLNGIGRSQLVWTNTVPRRLIDSTTGADLTTTLALVYPYTDADTQLRELGKVTLMRRDGQLVKRIERNRTKARAPVTQVAPAPSTPSTPKTTTNGRYVQVGTFGVEANAAATAQRLVRAGLPARYGTLKRGGKSYRVVLAGPFPSQTALDDGLDAARALGFSDAFIR